MAVDPSEPKKDEVINGDKVIEFIKAVKSLGSILESLNVIEVKDAFLVGKQIGAIENVLDLTKSWTEAHQRIHASLKTDLEQMERSIQLKHTLVLSLKQYANLVDGVNATTATLKEFCEVCDRLEKHRASGILEVVASLSKT